MNGFDLKILYFINHKLANPIADTFFVTIAESKLFLAAIIILAILLGWRGSTRARLGIAIALVSVALLDPFTHYILKPIFARPRPCHLLDDLRLIVGCGGRYGFPSNHAVNVFAAMTILSLFIRKYSIGFYSFAVLIGISRIYLGRHYPTDVLGGALIGIMLALFILITLYWTGLRFKKHEKIDYFLKDIRGALRWKQK